MKHPLLLIVLLVIVSLPFFLLWIVSAAVVNVGGFLLNIKREKRI